MCIETNAADTIRVASVYCRVTGQKTHILPVKVCCSDSCISSAHVLALTECMEVLKEQTMRENCSQNFENYTLQSTSSKTKVQI